jgi:phosphocarrier protein HPr
MQEIKSFEVKNKLGIHARVAAKLVAASSRFKSRIFLECDGQEVNGKSLLGILTLACSRGGFITVKVEGSDAVEALAALECLFAEKFGED